MKSRSKFFAILLLSKERIVFGEIVGYEEQEKHFLADMYALQ